MNGKVLLLSSWRKQSFLRLPHQSGLSHKCHDIFRGQVHSRRISNHSRPDSRAPEGREYLGAVQNVVASIATLDCCLPDAMLVGEEDFWEILSGLLEVRHEKAYMLYPRDTSSTSWTKAIPAEAAESRSRMFVVSATAFSIARVCACRSQCLAL